MCRRIGEYISLESYRRVHFSRAVLFLTVLYMSSYRRVHFSRAVLFLTVLYVSSYRRVHFSRAVLFLTVLYVSSYRRVHFSRAVLFHRTLRKPLLREAESAFQTAENGAIIRRCLLLAPSVRDP